MSVTLRRRQARAGDTKGRGDDERPAEAVTVDADVAITILLCFEVLLFALGGGFVVRYEMRRSAAEARLVAAREEQGSGPAAGAAS